MSVTDTSGKVLASFTGCEGAEINLVPGNYNYEYTLVASGALALNNSITTETTYSVRAYGEGHARDCTQEGGRLLWSG